MVETWHRALLVAVCAVGVVGLSGASSMGCGGSISSICDFACECEGCSDREYDDCIDNLEDVERDADREDCLAEYDDYLACVDEEGECNGDDYKVDGCGFESQDLGRCLD